MEDGTTKYLSKIQSGDKVLITDIHGCTKVVIVARAKIEKRPLILVGAEYKNISFSVLLQNEEVVAPVDRVGKPVRVVELKPGDEVLVSLRKNGRHLGIRVDE